MTDSVQIWSPGFRVLDDNGDPEAGAKLKFYDAGTSTPRTVYTDSGLSANASTVITCDSSGVPQVSSVDVCAYTNTSDYKVVITDSDDNVLITVDNLKGALDTSGYLTTASSLTMDVGTKSSNYTVVAGDLGTVLNCDASGGGFTITLLAAAGNDGATIAVRKTDSSTNVVTIDGNGAETINGSTTLGLTAQYSSVLLVCDGSDWHIVSSAQEEIINDVVAVDATYRTVSATAVVDDTIPQSSEGDSIDTVVITPSTSSAQVKLEWNLFGVSSADMTLVVSIFTDSETDATYSEVVTAVNGNYTKITGVYVDSPATTSAVTYTLRIGTTTGTFDINGSTSARLMGGVATTTLIASEF